jgi:hypothetical protein
MHLGRYGVRVEGTNYLRVLGSSRPHSANFRVTGDLAAHIRIGLDQAADPEERSTQQT